MSRFALLLLAACCAGCGEKPEPTETEAKASTARTASTAAPTFPRVSVHEGYTHIDLGRDAHGERRWREEHTAKDGLHIVAEFGGGGTMHFADNLTMSLPGATPLRLQSDVKGSLSQLDPDRVRRLSSGDWLVTGHSRWTGTDRIRHVMLVGLRDGAVKRIDEMRYHTTGGGSADASADFRLLVYAEGETLRVGLPEPTVDRYTGGWRAPTRRVAWFAVTRDGFKWPVDFKVAPLCVDATCLEDTGTMHYWEKLTLSLPGVKPIVLTTDVGGGALAPIVQQQFRLKDGRYLVLGWSSWGGGMQTGHALLIERTPDALKLVDELRVTQSRAEAGLIFRLDPDRPAVGFFEPKAPVHAGYDWGLVCSGKTLDVDAMQKLPYGPGVYPDGADRYDRREYCYFNPPFFRSAPPKLRVAWFPVTKTGFAWPR